MRTIAALSTFQMVVAYQAFELVVYVHSGIGSHLPEVLHIPGEAHFFLTIEFRKEADYFIRV